MRVMVLVKATEDSESGAPPDEQMLAEMGRFNEELVRAGVLLAADGLHTSSRAKRVQISEGATTVIDGPFAEAKELVAGFWIWQVRSMEEALEWARRCPNPMPGNVGVIELRPIIELDEIDTATPELREDAERLRAEVEARRDG